MLFVKFTLGRDVPQPVSVPEAYHGISSYLAPNFEKALDVIQHFFEIWLVYRKTVIFQATRSR
jgi:hypothetical protein